ncbi:hypothetical protein BZY52_13565, partial [Enterobacter hormaechei]
SKFIHTWLRFGEIMRGSLSAMRRLSLRSNADMYAWISSTQGMRELSLMSAYGEFEEWKRPLQQDISPSSKAAQ